MLLAVQHHQTVELNYVVIGDAWVIAQELGLRIHWQQHEAVAIGSGCWGLLGVLLSLLHPPLKCIEYGTEGELNRLDVGVLLLKLVTRVGPMTFVGLAKASWKDDAHGMSGHHGGLEILVNSMWNDVELVLQKVYMHNVLLSKLKIGR